MEGTLIETKSLANGLSLEMYDRSRRVAGDRSLVTFTAEIEVDVKPEYFEDGKPESPTYDDVKALLGDRVRYAYEGVRNFVPESEKQSVMDELKAYFIDSNLAYVSSPQFARRLVLRKYIQARNPMKAWRRI